MAVAKKETITNSARVGALLVLRSRQTRLLTVGGSARLVWLSLAFSLMALDASAGQPGGRQAIATPPAAATATSAQPFTTEAERCIIPASTYHGVNPWLLRAILRIESALKPGAFNRNSNGTIDIGIGQINSMHLPTLRKYGIDSMHLSDGCIGTYVSGWFLKKVIVERGNTWEGVASYHSRTPAFNQQYQQLLINELQRSQAMTPLPAPMPAPMPMQGYTWQPAPSLSSAPSTIQQQPSSPEKAAANEPGMMVFEQTDKPE